MFSKTTIALSAALILATTFTAAAQTQRRLQCAGAGSRRAGQQVKPFTEFEKLWFKQWKAIGN